MRKSNRSRNETSKHELAINEMKIIACPPQKLMDIAGAEKEKAQNAIRKWLYPEHPLRMYVRIAVYCTIRASIPCSQMDVDAFLLWRSYDISGH